MNEHIRRLIQQYRNKGLLLDTNLLVLLAVAAYDRALIRTDKRLKTYIPQDADVLMKLVGRFNPLITTPNIVTELSNLAGHLWQTRFPLVFRKQVDEMNEQYLSSKAAVQSDTFALFGLTDTTIAEIAKGRYLVLTDDLRLASYFGTTGD